MNKKFLIVIMMFSVFFPRIVLAELWGSCNSKKGCNTLKAACKKADGKYSTSGNNGFCHSKTAGNLGLSSTPVTGEDSTGVANTNITSDSKMEDAFCHKAAFCTKLKSSCNNRGGKWGNLPGGKGVCKD